MSRLLPLLACAVAAALAPLLARPVREAPPVAAPQQLEWIRPAALKPGDTIAFIAPAGPADAEKVAQAKERFEKMGFKVKVPPTLTKPKARYLAGSY